MKIRPKRKRSTKQEVTEAIQETVKEEVKEAVKEGITEQQTLFNKDAFKIGSASSNIISSMPKKASTSLVPVAGTAMVPISGVTTRYSETTQRKMAYGERRKREFFRNHFNMPYRWDDPIKLGSARTEPLMLVSHTPEEVAEINSRINGVTLGSATDDTARKKRIQDRLYRNEQRNLKNLRGTGGAESIMIGSARYNSENTFEAEQQREEDAKNRRKFVSDLATAILAAHKKNPIVDLLKYATLILGKHLPVLAAALITIAPLVGIFKGVRAMNTLRKAIVGGKGAGGVIKGVRGLRALKPSANLLAWFGLGPKALTTGVGRQLANGWNAGQGIGRIGTSLSYGFRAFTNQAKGFPVLNKVLPVTSKVWGSMKNAGQSVRAFTETSLKSGKIAPLLGSVFKKSFSGIGKVLLGGLKIGARGLLKGLLGPVMVGIDAISGFMATKGGKWWQRLFGILLKVLTLGFMSDKTIRKLVGMNESANEAAKQQNDDEERRHQERIGWWDRFWGWLKNILPWGKKDDITKHGDKTEAPTLGAADTNKALRNALEDKKALLASDKFRVGSKEYNKAIEAYKKEYATKETSGYWASKESHAKAYREKLDSEEAQKYAVTKLGTEAKALRNDIKRAETVMNGGVVSTGLMASTKGGKFGKGTFAGHNVTSGFGRRNTGIAGASTDHKGIDLDYNYENVGAFAAGKVIFAGQQKDKNGRLTGYGNYVVVQDAAGMKHTYGHLSKIGVQKGQQVRLGQSLGVSGNTGTSGGAHLHYGIQDKNNNFLNPLAVAASSTDEYLAALKSSDAAAGTSTMTDVQTKAREQATSELRDGLAKLVGAKNKSDKQERTRNIVLSATDVTGSLGVWGITQLNNGVMRTGR